MILCRARLLHGEIIVDSGQLYVDSAEPGHPGYGADQPAAHQPHLPFKGGLLVVKPDNPALDESTRPRDA